MDFQRNFDNQAEAYEASRPEYPRELYQDMLRYQPLDRTSQVLEIGLGSGKATKPVLETGCRLVGLEPGGSLAALARRRLRDYENLTLLEQVFQDYSGPDERFDLIYAATAFHWLPEDYGYRRVYRLLRPGGAFARFAYHAGPDRKRLALTEEVYKLYREHMNGGKGTYRPLCPEDGERLLAVPKSYGFEETEFHLYELEKNFTAEEYLCLLRTYPDHMALDEEHRAKLFHGIYQAIERHGGTMTVYYTVDLELARKPGEAR